MLYNYLKLTCGKLNCCDFGGLFDGRFDLIQCLLIILYVAKRISAHLHNVPNKYYISKTYFDNVLIT